MPCTRHDDHPEQQNRRMQFRSTFDRTLSGLRFSDQQNLQSFSISSPNQLAGIVPPLSSGVHLEDLTEQIRISVQDAHASGQRSFPNEVGGNISEVLENYEDDSMQHQLQYNNQEYIDNGIEVSGADSFDSLHLNRSLVSSNPSHLDIYTAHSSAPYSLDSERVFVRNSSNGSSHKQDPSSPSSPSTSSSSTTNASTTLVFENQFKPSSSNATNTIKTANSSTRRQRTSKKNCNANQLQINRDESEVLHDQQNDEEKMPSSQSDELESEDIFDKYDRIFHHSNHRQAGVITNFLYDGSSFKGFQTSSKESYEVQVDILHVDYSNSYLCGYLCINHLTKNHPSLTTFFDGEIISKNHSFLTKRWQASREIDLAHWSKFQGFDERWLDAYYSDSSDLDEIENSDYIYMRWKEHFLVPDHKVKHVEGASYEGFYYICYSKLTASIKGFYFHSNSENFESFQSLNLELERKASSQVYEFR